MPRMQLGSLIVRLVVFAGVAWSFVWVFWVQHEDIGSFTEVRNGATHISAGTSSLAILMSVLGLVVYCIVLNTRVKVENFRVAPLWRRAAAFVVDFWFAVFILGALFGFVDILLEANRTGIFRWHFQRDYLVSADGASLVLVFVGLAAFVAYFLLPLMRRSQTVGGWIFSLAPLHGCLEQCNMALFSMPKRKFRVKAYAQ
jgi:RDD family